VHDGERSVPVERHEWRQAWVEREKAVEIERCLGAIARPEASE